MALHKWFFVGRKLKNAASEPAQSFKLFYSAGCLGHKLAVFEAGQMLLDPNLNAALPVIVTYKDLEPEVAQWDIRRLNQPEITTPKLQAFYHKVQEIGPQMEGVSPENIDKMFRSLLEELSLIEEETIDKQVLHFLLSEFYAHYQKHQEIDSFDPQKVENFVKNLPYKTPFLEVFFPDLPSKSVKNVTDIPDFKGI